MQRVTSSCPRITITFLLRDDPESDTRETWGMIFYYQIITFCKHCFLIFKWLVNRARSLAQVLITNVVNLSRKFNQGIRSQYDTIVRKITHQAESTEELVKLQDYTENLRVGELLDLRVRKNYILKY